MKMYFELQRLENGELAAFHVPISIHDEISLYPRVVARRKAVPGRETII